MEEKKAMTPIEEQALDQVTGGYISPWEIFQDRLIIGDAMICPYCKAFVGPEFWPGHSKECPNWPKDKM